METIDLFTQIEKLPKAVQEIIEKYAYMLENSEIDGYQLCSEFLNELKPHGYKFDYYLDAVPFNLEKIKYALILGEIDFTTYGKALIFKINGEIKLFNNEIEAEEYGESNIINTDNSYLVLGGYNGKIIFKNIDIEIDLIHKLLNETMLSIDEIHNMTGSSKKLIAIIEKCGKFLPFF